MVTSSPITVGWVLLVTWMVVRSCTLVREPIRLRFTSPRSTQPNQMDDRSPISTSPRTTAPGATKALAWTTGVVPPNGRRIGISAADASPRLAARQADGDRRPEDRAGGIGRPVERVGVPPGDEGLVPLVECAVEAGGEDGEPERPAGGRSRDEEPACDERGQQAEDPRVDDLVGVRERRELHGWP